MSLWLEYCENLAAAKSGFSVLLVEKGNVLVLGKDSTLTKKKENAKNLVIWICLLVGKLR